MDGSAAVFMDGASKAGTVFGGLARMTVGDSEMVGRREAQGTVDRFQRLACLEAVKRQKIVTPEDVASWCTLPVADVVRHLNALKSEGRIEERAGIFSVR